MPLLKSKAAFLAAVTAMILAEDKSVTAHEYGEALKLTIDFYCAQRSGADLTSNYCDVPFAKPSGEQDGWVQAVKFDYEGMSNRELMRTLQNYRTDSLEESLFGENDAQNMANLNMIEGGWTYTTKEKFREDLSGGWYDAGDYVKFALPLASTITTQSWSMIDFKGGFERTGQWERMVDQVKWATDWMLKATAKIDQGEIVAQIGSPEIDHKYWGRADTWLSGSRPGEPGSRYWTTCRINPDDSQDMVQGGGEPCKWKGDEETAEGDIPFRPVYKITKNNPGSEVAGMYVASLASASMAFRETGTSIVDESYADQLLDRAKAVHEFAIEYQGSFIEDGHIPAYGYYGKGVTGYKAHLAHGAAWLYKATGDVTYLNQAISFDKQDMARDAYGWQMPTYGTKTLLASFDYDGSEEQAKMVQDYLKAWENSAKTPDGLVWQNPTFWGSNRWAANQAFIALTAAKYGVVENKQQTEDFWSNQIDIILGPESKKQQRKKVGSQESHSWLVGYGIDPPRAVHHAPSSCGQEELDSELSCSWDFYATNYGVVGNPIYDMFIPSGMTLHGALAGGPYTCSGHWTDLRPDFHGNEVAIDYNAGFQAALGAVSELKSASRSTTLCGPAACAGSAPEGFGEELITGWPPEYCSYEVEYDDCHCITDITSRECTAEYKEHIVCPGLVEPEFVGARANYPGWCMCEEGWTGSTCQERLKAGEPHVQGNWKDAEIAFSKCDRDLSYSCEVPKSTMSSKPQHGYKAGTSNIPMAGDSVLRMCNGNKKVNGQEFWIDFCEYKDGKAQWQSQTEGDACSLCGTVDCGPGGSCRMGECISDADVFITRHLRN